MLMINSIYSSRELFEDVPRAVDNGGSLAQGHIDATEQMVSMEKEVVADVAFDDSGE